MSLPHPGPLPKPPRKAAPGARPAPAGSPSVPAAQPSAPARPAMARPAAPQAAAPHPATAHPAAAPARPAAARPPARPGAMPAAASRAPSHGAPAHAGRPVAVNASARLAAAAPTHSSAHATVAQIPPIDLKGMPAVIIPMIEAIRLYDELLCEENAALRAGNSKAVEALLDRKVAATRLYQERLRNLLGDAQNTKSLTPDQRTRIVGQVRCLEQRAHENTILLKANMNAIEQLFEVINTAARKMRHQDLAYSKAGLVEDSYMRNGVSLAYNNSI